MEKNLEIFSKIKKIEQKENKNRQEIITIIIYNLFLKDYETLKNFLCNIKENNNTNTFDININIPIKILKKLIKDPISNIFDELAELKKNVDGVNDLIDSFARFHEDQQATALSRFYSKISLKTLKSYIGSQNFPSGDLETYLTNYGFSYSSSQDFIQLVERTHLSTINSHDLFQKLTMLHQNSLDLENIIKENIRLK